MRRLIAKHARDFTAILTLIAIAAAVSGYTLLHERLRFPFFSTSRLTMYADFSTAQAVTPGQGQTVTVAGVKIGDIGGVSLHDGIARVKLTIDHKYRRLLHTDATALLRPRTGLQDMFIELNPGSKGAPSAPPGFVIPLANTLPDVNPDQVESTLDTDTRDYVQLLIGGAGQGLYNTGHGLQAVFEKFQPTFHDITRINHAVAQRHANVTRLAHSLNLLNTALAQRGPELTQLIRYSSQVFNGYASEQAPLRRAIGDLPGTLSQATSTLGRVQTLAQVLGPTAQNLRPFARVLPSANRAITPFAQRITPVIRDQIRPFVVAARPLVRALSPAARNLATATPRLTASFTVLNHLFNMLGYNQSGSSDPVADPHRNEGYLFWLAWLTHDAASVFGSADATGIYRTISQEANCATINSEVGGASSPLAPLAGVADLLLNPALCGPSGLGGPLTQPAPRRSP